MKRVSRLSTIASIILLALFSLTNLTAAPAASRLAKPDFARVKAVSPFEIDLTWRDHSDNEDGFQIERSTDRTNFRQIAQVLPGTTIYRDKNLFPGTQYFYRVRAFNASGTSRYDTTSARTQTPPVPLSVAEWSSPANLTTPTNADLVSVSAGAFHSLGLKKDGTVIAWGFDYLGEITVPTNLTNVIAVSAGDGFSLALKSDGTVVEWGNEATGRYRVPPPIINFPPPTLLHPIFPPPPLPPTPVPIQPIPILPIQPVLPISDPVTHPIQIIPPTPPPGDVLPQLQSLSAARPSAQSRLSPPDNLTGVVAISAGLRHSLALKSDGTVVAWGFDISGDTEVPPGLTGVVEIAAGVSHSLALKSDGTVVGWGGGTSGAGTPPTNLTSVVAIAAGLELSLAVKSDGTIVAWGAQAAQTTNATSGLADVTSVAIGVGEGAALKKDGSLFNWFFNLPTAIVPDLGASVLAISANYYHFAALSTAPTAPSDSFITVLSENQLRLSWRDNSSDEKSFAIERISVSNNVISSWTQIGTVGANTTNFTDSTVQTNVSYSYRVRAIGKFGTSPYCMEARAVLAPLVAPQTLTAAWGSTNEVILSWHSDFSGIDGYKIERAPDDNGVPGAWAEIASMTVSNANQNTFTDTNALPDNTYWYRVQSFNVLGSSPYSNPIAVPVVPPLEVVNFASTTYGSNVILFWSANPNTLLPTGYKLEFAPENNGYPGAWFPLANVPASVTTFTDYGRPVGEPRWYRLRAYNWVGDSPYIGPFQITLPPTPVPYALSGSVGIAHSIDLRWDTLQADGFEVERAADINGSPGAWTQIAIVSNDWARAFQGSFSDTNVVANTTYWYRVRAFSTVGYSDYTDPLQISTSPPLDAPVRLSLDMADGVEILWDYVPSDLVGFRIERAGDANGVAGTWGEIGTVIRTNTIGSFLFTDTNALPNTIYWYRVRAFNWVGYSDYSDPKNIDTLPPAAPINFYAQAYRHTAQLSWDAILGGYIAFEIERAPDASGSPGAWTLVGTTNGYVQSYTDSGLVANTTYWYRVRASNWAGYSPYTTPLSITIARPNAPNFLVAKIGFATNSVDLNWVDYYQDADIFDIEYAPDTNGAPGVWSQIATLAETNDLYLSFTDTNVIGFTTNWYRVRAVNDIGISDYTTPARIALLPPPLPTDFVGNASDIDQINLFWLDLDDLVQGYKLERAPDVAGAPGAWSEVFNGRAGQNVFLTVGDLNPGTTYWYRLRAFNWVGDSAFTGPISITTISLPWPTPAQILSLTQTNGGMLIEWSTASGNTDIVQASGNFSTGYTNLSPALVISGFGTMITNYFDAGALTNSPARFYRIHSSRRSNHTAPSPCSSVRIRTALSSDDTKIFPSPIFPVRAFLEMISTAPFTRASGSTISIFTLGRKSTVYSLPR
jgi:hypothetical protein